MKKIVFIFVVLLSIFGSVNAQVGIGVAVPNTKSILDLTNSTNGKALILPQPISPPDISGNFDTEAMVFYYLDKIYVRTSSGLNVLSPWLYDGTPSNGISIPSGTPVGIGMTPLATPSSNLQIANTGDATELSSIAAVTIGSTSTKHILIDNDEILAKTNPTTVGVLKLQEDGAGSVQIRSSGADAGITTVLTAYGSVDAKGKIRENGKDLLPVGSIIMWSGSTVPAGWALCDGGSYPLEDGSGNVTPPNLMDRFIVGADIGGNGVAGSYPVADTGGESEVVLTATQIPSHSHTITIPNGGSHQHQALIDTGGGGSFGTDPGGGGVMYTCGDGASGNSGGNPIANGTAPTTFAGSHNHSGASIGFTGGSLSHENKPPYFALAFIMKL